MKFITQNFLPQALQFVFRTLDSTTALPPMGAILNSETTNKRYKNVKNMALSKQKITLVYHMRTETDRQNVTLFSLRQLKTFTSPHMHRPLNDQQNQCKN